jgi:hypothetical protein
MAERVNRDPFHMRKLIVVTALLVSSPVLAAADDDIENRLTRGLAAIIAYDRVCKKLPATKMQRVQVLLAVRPELAESTKEQTDRFTRTAHLTGFCSHPSTRQTVEALFAK